LWSKRSSRAFKTSPYQFPPSPISLSFHLSTKWATNSLGHKFSFFSPLSILRPSFPSGSHRRYVHSSPTTSSWPSAERIGKDGYRLFTAILLPIPPPDIPRICFHSCYLFICALSDGPTPPRQINFFFFPAAFPRVFRRWSFLLAPSPLRGHFFLVFFSPYIASFLPSLVRMLTFPALLPTFFVRARSNTKAALASFFFARRLDEFFSGLASCARFSDLPFFPPLQ